MNIVQIAYHLNYFADGIYYIYYLNVALELFFAILLAVNFFPLRNSLFYLIEVNYYIYFTAEIKENKEQNLNINNLSIELLKKDFIKSEYPLVLVEPFSKADNLFRDSHLHLGIAKEK